MTVSPPDTGWRSIPDGATNLHQSNDSSTHHNIINDCIMDFGILP